MSHAENAVAGQNVLKALEREELLLLVDPTHRREVHRVIWEALDAGEQSPPPIPERPRPPLGSSVSLAAGCW